MLKIDVIKFEAQDVITASVAAHPEKTPTCHCNERCYYSQDSSKYIHFHSEYCDAGYCEVEKQP